LFLKAFIFIVNLRYKLIFWSKHRAKSHVVPFIHAVYIILTQNHILVFFSTIIHWYLIKIRVKLIFENFYFAIVSDRHSSLIISENLIFFNFRKTASGTNYAWSLVFTYLIIWNVITRVENDDTITVIVYVIMFYPTKPTFYRKNPFRSRLENSIVQNQGVGWIISTVCYVGLIISINFVFFYQGWGCVYKENSLTEITEYVIIYNFDLGWITGLHSRFSIVANMMIFFNTSKIFFTFAANSIFKIFFNVVASYDGVSSQIILGEDMDSVAFVFPDFIEHDERIWTYSLNTILALLDFT